MSVGHFIDGNWSQLGPLSVTIDPSTNAVVTEFHQGTVELMAQAIACARRCFELTPWRAQSRRRAAMLLECADALAARHDEIASMLARENGKPITQAHHEVSAAINECRYYAGLARNIFGRSAEYEAGQQSLFTREPIGVAAVIVPWNAPATLLIRSLAPAIAAGCCAVIKPAAETSGTHHLLMQAIASCPSLEKGAIVSVNDGGIALSEYLVKDVEIDVISFTGSTTTGKQIMANAAGTLKRLSLELGGKSPAVVFADADLDKAVAEISRAVVPHCGQMCTAIGRAIVHKDLIDPFIEKMKVALSAFKIGSPVLPGTQLGPLINSAAAARYLDNVKLGAQEGEMLLRGEILSQAPNDAGTFVTPTMIRLENTASALIQKELFAPYLIVESFIEARDAVASANATRYGLTASVYTEGLANAQSAARAIKAGTVWINCHNRLMVEAETGGYRESGLGRLHGTEGLSPFLETKHIYTQVAAL